MAEKNRGVGECPKYLPLVLLPVNRRPTETPTTCSKSQNWHERSAFQLVAIQAVDWHNDSGPLFSLFFSLSFPLAAILSFEVLIE